MPPADTKPALPLEPLSAVQRQICEMLVESDYSLKEIATRIEVTEDAMTYHRGELGWKFRCKTWPRIAVEFERAKLRKTVSEKPDGMLSIE